MYYVSNICTESYDDIKEVKEMKDKEFLIWLYERLIHQYGESPNVDFAQRLKSIADSTTEDIESDVSRPHRITLYNIFGESVHVDAFATMKDASRTYSNMCQVIRERKEKGGTSNISRIGLSTIHCEAVV